MRDVSTLIRVHFVNTVRPRATRVQLCTSGVHFVDRVHVSATKLTFRTLTAPHRTPTSPPRGS